VTVEPAPPRNWRRGLLYILFALVAAGLIAGWPAGPTRWPAAGPAAIHSDAQRVHDGDLRAFLLPPPRQALPWPAPPTPDERLSAAQQAARYRDPAERVRFLLRYGFQAGAVRAWTQPDGVRVRIDLFRLDDPAGFVAAEEEDLAGHYPPGAVYPVPQVTSGRAYVSTADGVGLTRVVFRRGDVVAELGYAHPGRPDPDEAVRQALAQYQRL
jgi:hypothetical protein